MRSICPYSVRMWENTDRKTPNTDAFHAVLKIIGPKIHYDERKQKSVWIKEVLRP